MKILNDSHMPIYSQIGSQLKQKILKGGFPEGRLPLARELATSYGVSLLTVNRAISLLVKEGICLSKPRVGIFINPMVFSGFRWRIVYVGSAFYHGADMDYGSRLIGLSNPALYPECQVDTYFLNFASEHSYQLEYELRGLCSKHLDCLVLGIDRKIRRELLSELLNLSVPIFAIGDFSFGELKEPLINQIREDTAERGRTMVKVAAEAGKRDLVIVTHDETCNYYVRLLREGALLQGGSSGVRVRFLTHDDDSGGDAVKRAREAECLRSLAVDGVPEVMILDGYYGDVKAYLADVCSVWQRDRKSVLLMSTGNYLEHGLFLHLDYTAFAATASSVIMDSLRQGKRFVGCHTFSGLISYQIFKPCTYGRQHGTSFFEAGGEA